MKRLASVSLRVILGFAIVISLWLTMTNFFSIGQDFTEIKNGYACLILLGLLAILSVGFLVSKRFWRRILTLCAQHVIIVKVLIALVVILSIVARFSFLALEFSPADNDSASFYTIAGEFAASNSLGDHANYVALFPYVMNYNLLLGAVMKVFGINNFSIILLNTLLDVLATVLLFLILRKLTKSKQTAQLGALIWWVSPFNIVFSALSLPIIAVNTLILAALWLILRFVQNLMTKYAPLYALGAGVVLSLANSLRPIMIIFVIALVIYMALQFLSAKRGELKPIRVLGLLALVVIPYLGLNAVYTQAVAAMTNLPPTKNSSGWSVYVGANFETAGQWNSENGHLDKVLAEEESLTSAQKRLLQEGVGRWLAMSGSEVMQLLVRKSLVLGADQADAIYDLKSYPAIWKRERVRILLHVLCTVYALVLIVASLCKFLADYKKSGLQLGFVHYLALVVVGLFLASLLVEVSSRYFMPFFPLLTIVATVYLAPKLKLLDQEAAA